MVKNIASLNPNVQSQSDSVEKIDRRDPKVLEAARMYEQAFLKQMVGAMRQAVPKSDLVKESMGERIYKDQMYDNYVEQWSNVGGVGLGDLIYDQIIERFGPQQKQIRPQGPLPANDNRTYQIENDSSQTGAMLMKFKPQKNFGEGSMQITSPWEGELIGSNNLESGEKALFIKHPNDMKSTFIFKGSLNLSKNNFSPGESLGVVSPETNEFLWKLEGKKV